jgi:hypothetical protein
VEDPCRYKLLCLMSLEAIYSDLEAIAKKRGPLNEDAVRTATAILAQPRYAESPSPGALLIKDLERVIEAIPNYPAPETSPPWASQNFRDYARRYFSLDASGQTFTHRRTFGRKETGGSVGAWMSRGVLYRVAAGLLELWADASNPDAADGGEMMPGYRIDSVQATRRVEPDPLRPTRNVLKFDLRLTAPGPHLLVLPFMTKSTTLIEVSTERADGTPKSQLMPVESDGGWTFAAVAFGAQQPPGERVQIMVENRPLREIGPHVWSAYRPNQSIGSLILEVIPYSTRDYKWEVLKTDPGESDYMTINTPSSGIWRCENPDEGVKYELHGTPLKRAERRQKRLDAQVSPGPELDNIGQDST